MIELWVEGGTFILFVTVCVARLPSLVRSPKAQPAWLATFFGSVGFLALGIVIPLPVVDGWLGGTNVANLVQDECALLAFWFFRIAILEYTQNTHMRYPRWLLGVILFTAGAPFFLIRDRGSTNPLFGVDHISQLATLGYEDLYFFWLVFFCIGMLFAIRPSSSKLIRFIAVGLTLMMLGSLDDASFMTMHFFHVTNSVALGTTFNLFYALFYPGAFVVVCGLGAILLIERQYPEHLLWTFRVFRLRRLQAKLMAQSQRSRNIVIHVQEKPRSPLEQAYQLVVTFHNLEIKETVTVSPRERAMVNRIEQRLGKALRIDAELPTSFEVRTIDGQVVGSKPTLDDGPEPGR